MTSIPKKPEINIFKNVTEKSKNTAVKLSSTESISKLQGKTPYIPTRKK